MTSEASVWNIQEEADRRAQDMALSKAAYEESKARLKQAEEKVRMVCEK